MKLSLERILFVDPAAAMAVLVIIGLVFAWVIWRER
jgi:regulatory protein YycH of two-component signal transduction system YycFG